LKAKSKRYSIKKRLFCQAEEKKQALKSNNGKMIVRILVLVLLVAMATFVVLAIKYCAPPNDRDRLKEKLHKTSGTGEVKRGMDLGLPLQEQIRS
jgi:hypothetical protein